jgi:hypothetical protein
MLHAISVSAVPSIAAAGLALGLGLGLGAEPTPPCVTHRLSLQAVDAPNAVYLTPFRHGDIRVTFQRGEIRPFRIKTTASLSDGCRWVALETFVPRDQRSFHYDYSEHIESCEPGSTPYLKTPRRGIVSIEE